MKLSEQPVWLVGFRPFFVLACLAGMVLPVVWAMMFSGKLLLPATPFSIVLLPDVSAAGLIWRGFGVLKAADLHAGRDEIIWRSVRSTDRGCR